MKNAMWMTLIIAQALVASPAAADSQVTSSPRKHVMVVTRDSTVSRSWSQMPSGYALQYHRQFVVQPMNGALSGRRNIGKLLSPRSDLRRLLSGGVDIRTLLSGGFDLEQLLSAGVDLNKLLSAGIDPDARWRAR